MPEFTARIARAQPGALEPEPLVHDGVMYLPHPDDVVQALDARNGTVIWEYRRRQSGDSRGGGLNRNLALYQDKVFVGTSDAHLVALDARTGRVVWDVAVADPRQGFRYTSGPIAGDGRVFASLSCSGNGPARCFVAAHDAATGDHRLRNIDVGTAALCSEQPRDRERRAARAAADVEHPASGSGSNGVDEQGFEGCCRFDVLRSPSAGQKRHRAYRESTDPA